MSVQLDIKLKRANKVYFEGENIAGVIYIDSSSEFKHDGINLLMEGLVNLQLSSKNIGLFDAFYNSVKPIQLTQCIVEIAVPGKMPTGVTNIPFEVPLKAKLNRTLFETYHGVFINIQYTLKCELKRSFLSKGITKVLEFFTEYKRIQDKLSLTDTSLKFLVKPESVRKTQDDPRNIPKFSITGLLHSTTLNMNKPFTGELTVEYSEIAIKSIELQLVRIETCGCAEGYARDATEVQNIQIGDGNVPYKIPIPIYMVLPRLFACPTLIETNFKIEFEVNVVVIFEDDNLITENFPIILVR